MSPGQPAPIRPARRYRLPSGGSAGPGRWALALVFLLGGNSVAQVRRIGRDGWSMVVAGEQRFAMDRAEAVTALDLSPGGRWLATGAMPGVIRLWDGTTGTLLWSRKLRPGDHHPVRALAFGRSGRVLAVLAGDHRIRLVDPGTGLTRKVLASGIRDLVDVRPLEGPAGFLVAGLDGSLGRLDAGGTPAWIVPGDGTPRTGLDLVPDLACFVTAGRAGPVELRILETGDVTRTFQVPGAEELTALAVAGSRLAAATASGSLLRWNLDHPGPPGRTRVPAPITSLSASPDGRRLLAVTRPGSTGPRLMVLSASRGTRLRTLATGSDPIAAARWTSSGKRLVAVTRWGRIRSWEWGDPTRPGPGSPDVRGVTSITWGGIGGLLYLGREDGSLRSYDPGEDRVRDLPVTGRGAVRGLWASASGEVATAVWSSGQMRRIDVEAGRVLVEGRAGVRSVHRTAFSTDGRLVAVGGFGSVEVRDLDQPVWVRELRGLRHDVSALAFWPDGRHLSAAGSGDRTVRTLDLTTGAATVPIEVERRGSITALAALAGTGELLVAFSPGLVGIHDPGTSTIRLAFPTDLGAVLDLLPLPGRRALLLRDARALEIRSLADGALQARFPGAAGPGTAWEPSLRAWALDAAGKRLALARGDGTLSLLVIPGDRLEPPPAAPSPAAPAPGPPGPEAPDPASGAGSGAGSGSGQPGADVVEQQVDQDPGDRDVQPDGQGDAGERPVP